MGREDAMRETTRTRKLVPGRVMLLAAAVIVAPPALAQDQDRPFRSMSVDDGRETLCEMPEVPAELTPTNGHEDAYLYWLEKLELERRLETGECDCLVDEITWEEVGERALPWLADPAQTFPWKRRYILEEVDALRGRVAQECTG